MMLSAQFHFHGDLIGLLKKDQQVGFTYHFTGSQSAKHLIESVSVPHTEVGSLQVNILEQNLGWIVQNGEQVDVFPCPTPLLPEPDPRFILDNHLGRLAAGLRLLGFDCLYRNDYQDEELAAVSAAEDRILLTRDRRLLMRKIVLRGRLLRSIISAEQLDEILQRYALKSAIQPFRRCPRCNGILAVVEKAEIDALLQPLTREYFHEFKRCPDCRQIYWKGSHYDHMQSWIERL